MELLDLTGRLVGLTLTDTNLRSAVGLRPEASLRAGDGIYQLFGKVVGHAPIGIWLALHWVGQPGGHGVYQWGEDARSYLVQWSWVITMTLHPEPPDPEEWLRRQLGGLEGPMS